MCREMWSLNGKMNNVAEEGVLLHPIGAAALLSFLHSYSISTWFYLWFQDFFRDVRTDSPSGVQLSIVLKGETAHWIRCELPLLSSLSFYPLT